MTSLTLKTLDEITVKDLPAIGGKAFNCARLKRAGFPVPEAIVVPTATGFQGYNVVVFPDRLRPGSRLHIVEYEEPQLYTGS